MQDGQFACSSGVSATRFYQLRGEHRAPVLRYRPLKCLCALPEPRVDGSGSNPVDQLSLGSLGDFLPVESQAGAGRDDPFDVVKLFVMVGDAEYGYAMGQRLVDGPIAPVSDNRITMGQGEVRVHEFCDVNPGWQVVPSGGVQTRRHDHLQIVGAAGNQGVQ